MKIKNPKTDREEVPIFEPEEDEIGRRYVETEDKQEYVLVTYDPHGWFKVQAKKGKVPEVLSGWYTSEKAAKTAIAQYLGNRK